ncbi:aminopeptidase P family protein [Deinococcus metallilatus]|uniref:Aminopeptidase P family protein n=1 Tax=Deinococcus metallilatus TaxID=1211322 RepID=A0AAJ5JYR0_9DEIO|nr:Xaa-Pro peptidase family protein [Deinococcus metallilatus]MBB5294086.1 Xaa-Pro aminopeptidase/Xaa-Pro dipeptidase [Deinococcus metallilatus]QBY08871.1 aminopeptidase P family protein [Deinococcus metallilatus]RXJ10015.1 aminopeptidase P family protein [Deinococcus metallilatus]TLK28048.1 aminopeptidase P family protein [Deinococcus metallilatus]GMA16578.1 aminopeptidase [Deinococcus metallilatus]
MTQLDQLRAAMKAAGVDALWVSNPANVRALSGFSSGQDGKVLVTGDGATLYTDARYTVQAQEESQVPQVIARPPETYQDAAQKVKGARVGFEAEHLTVAGLEALREHWDAALVPTRGLVEGVRLVKSPQEVQAIREAQAVADRVFGEVRPMIRAGVRELDVALALEMGLRRAGAEVGFDVIVASGPRGAMPHGVASERVIEDGDLVTIDFGARVNGYHSDMTRTVAVGTPSEDLRRVYNAVLEAEEAAVAAVRPGARTGDLDALARGILERHGLAEAFAHSLGHGVGLNIHEGPSLRKGSEDVLEPGMVVTVEPGAYLPGVGGVRLEDLVLVTEDGHEVLSRAPKERL